MAKDTGAPTGRQRGRALTRAEWQKVAADETQAVMRRALWAFIRRHPSENYDDLSGIAQDEVENAVRDWVEVSPQAFSAYLRRRVLWRLGRHRFERWRRRRLLAENHELMRDDPVVVSSWEMLATAKRLQQHEVVKQAIAALPVDHQTMIRGVFFEGRSQREIARELKMSPSAAGRLYQDALVRLRTEMMKRGMRGDG